MSSGSRDRDGRQPQGGTDEGAIYYKLVFALVTNLEDSIMGDGDVLGRAKLFFYVRFWYSLSPLAGPDNLNYLEFYSRWPAVGSGTSCKCTTCIATAAVWNGWSLGRLAPDLMGLKNYASGKERRTNERTKPHAIKV